MTTMISELYDTFRAANETRFAGIELRIERIDGRLTLIQWMLALLIGGVASLVIKAFMA